VYRGRHLWSRGYFAATVGAVTEEHIKRCIESQDDVPESFKIWDETVKEDEPD
jgi:putative transposase